MRNRRREGRDREEVEKGLRRKTHEKRKGAAENETTRRKKGRTKEEG